MNLYIMTNQVNFNNKMRILSGLILLTAQILIAQTGSNPSPVNYNIDVYPKTPEAAALSKFVDIPAGSYTGVADFSIPFYTIEFDGGSIPIELRYTTTGIKVGEIASRVGLGWVLNTGPSLSQQVIGVQDHVFPKPVVPRNPFQTIESEDDYIIAATAAGIITNGNSPKDIKPDIFNYSLLRESGKFILDSDGQYGIPMPYNQIKITPSSYYAIMDMVDEEGTQYKFEKYPVVSTKNTCANDDMLGLIYPDPNFKITNVKSPKNDQINYFYGQNTNGKYINSITTQERISISIFTTTIPPPSPASSKCTTYTISSDPALTEIQFKGGKVLFSYSGNGVRTDVNGEVYLTGVVVKNDNNEIIKSFTLTYDYFESPEAVPTYGVTYSFLNDYAQGMNKRLKLVSVKDNLTNGTYHLDYYESSDDGKVLPVRTSNDQDYWGVFNGAGNGQKSTPFTKYTKNGVVRIFQSEHTGANKEPDINYGKLGNLRKITYPTGGYTQIEYEADDYIKTYGPPVYDYLWEDPEHFAYDTDPYPIEFDIPENAYNKELQFWGQYHSDGHHQNGDCRWYLYKWDDQAETYNEVTNQHGTTTNERNDGPGHYKLWVVPTDPHGGAKGEEEGGCKAEYRWLNEFIIDDSETRKAGTIRVSRIESFDNNDGKIIREYTYKEPTENHILPYTKSSGKNLGNELFISLMTQEYPLDANGGYAIERLLTNNPGWQTATVRGKPIGYDYVQEKYISENNPSKSYRKEYKFKNDIDDVWAQHDPYSPINYTWPIEGLDRGLILEEKLFDSSNKLVKETKKEYMFDTHFNQYATSYIGGSFLGEGLEIIPIRKTGNTSSSYQFEMRNFPIKNFWITDTLTTTIEYNTPADYITTVQKTKYSITHYKHTYPVETLVTGSLGESMRTEYYYPQDLLAYYEPAQETLMNRLRQRNQLSSPVITKTFADGTPVSEQRTHYAHFYYTNNDPFTGFILPQYIYLKKGEIGAAVSAEDKKITYDYYDDKGNLKQYTMENGMTVSIIWGYDKKYPIAKVENIAYTSIPALELNNAVGASNTGTETSLRTSLQALREALPATAVITTYTYNPLVGVTSMMAPNGQESFYRYDNAGRLDKVLDQYGNVLKKMEYHYKD